MYQDGECLYAVGQVVEGRGVVFHGPILALFSAADIVDELLDGGEGAAQVVQLVFLHEGAFETDALDAVAHVEEVGEGHVLLLQHAAHLPCLAQEEVDLLGVGGEVHLVYFALAQCGEAVALEQVAYFVDTKFLFKVVWIYHFPFVSLPVFNVQIYLKSVI